MCGWRRAEACSCGGFHLANQLIADFEQPFRCEGSRLLDEVHGARVERIQGEFTRLAGDADDDDGKRLARHLCGDETDTVEVRHDEVARDHVGMKLGYLIEGFAPVPGDTDDFQRWAAR